MLREKNRFGLDCLDRSDTNDNAIMVPVLDGLVIKRKVADDFIPMAYVLPDINNSYYIKTIGNSLQTFVATYEDYKDFIYIVDEAYDLIAYATGTDICKEFKYENSNF